MSAEQRLRGHHFICLQFYDGGGMTPEYAENVRRVAALARTEPALVVAGADDVCAACPGLSAEGACVDANAGEPEIDRLDRLAWTLLRVAPGDRLTLAEAGQLFASDPKVAEVWRGEACTGCEWDRYCAPAWEDFG
jgi:uncharacterized protein